MFSGPNIGCLGSQPSLQGLMVRLLWSGVVLRDRDLQDGEEMPEESHLQSMAWRGGSDRLWTGLPASDTQSPLDRVVWYKQRGRQLAFSLSESWGSPELIWLKEVPPWERQIQGQEQGQNSWQWGMCDQILLRTRGLFSQWEIIWVLFLKDHCRKASKVTLSSAGLLSLQGEEKAAADTAKAGPQPVSLTDTRTQPQTGWEQLLETH